MSTSPQPPPGASGYAEGRRAGLPARLSSFVGRGPEIAELTRLLVSHRLISLVGPPGVGKTRLALEVADRAQAQQVEAAVFVELAGLAEPDLVPQVVATALGVQDRPGQDMMVTVAEAIASREIVVVLDNCEHLIETCAHLTEALLVACPRLRVLATSREALRCDGELIWRVPSLSTPADALFEAGSPSEALAPSSLLSFEAVQLFVERASTFRPDFKLTVQRSRAVATICRQLEGIPLALELAAARLTVLSPEQIAERIEDRLRLLTGGSRTASARQQTLEATIDWSYRLLPEIDQTLLRRLSVFAGGWTFDAAEAVCQLGETPSPFLDVFGRLVEKSLVQVDEDAAGEPRFRLLEMIRQFAFERLIEAGEVTLMRDRHRDWLLAYVERVEPLHYWAPTVQWLDQLEANRDNVRAALDWCVVSPSFASSDNSQSRDAAFRLALAAFWPWFSRGHIGELRWWFQTLLRSHEHMSPRLLARATIAAGLLAEHQDDLVEATALQERGFACADRCGDAWAMAWSIQASGLVARRQDDLDRSERLCRESLERFQTLGDAWSVSWGLRNLGVSALRAGDLSRARELLTESLRVTRSIGDDYCASLALTYLGQAACVQGEYDEAFTTLAEALDLARRFRYARGIGAAAEWLGRTALLQGNLRQAAALLRESAVVRERMGDRGAVAACLASFATLASSMRADAEAVVLGSAAIGIRAAPGGALSPADRRSIDAAIAAARSHLDPATVEQSWERGANSTIQTALAIAEELCERVLSTEEAGSPAQPSAPPTNQRTDLLTTREREVAALVAQGLTDRQIAERLVVSRRTVNAYVASILGRLGFATRTQIAVWAVERGCPAPDLPGMR